MICTGNETHIMRGISFQSFPAFSSSSSSPSCTALTTKQAITEIYTISFCTILYCSWEKNKQVLICLKPTTNPSKHSAIWCLKLYFGLCACLFAKTSNNRIRIVHKVLTFSGHLGGIPAEKTDSLCALSVCACVFFKLRVDYSSFTY